MNRSYFVNFRCQLLSLKQALILVAACPVVLLLNTIFPLGALIGRPNAKTIPLDEYWETLPLFVLIMLVLCFPAFLLHCIYLIKNRRLWFEVNGDKININEGGSEWNYTIADIINAEKVLDIFHKNNIDNRGRMFAPWSDYGYIKVEFYDGKICYLTSLMLQPETFEDFPTKVRYTWLPFLTKKSIAKLQEEKKQAEQVEKVLSEEKIEEFYLRFSNCSDETLTEKINDSRYCKEAKIAARQILEKRGYTVDASMTDNNC